MADLKDLNIVVLLKQVPVPKAMKTKADGMMDRSGKSMINPYCDNALEEALKLREQTGGKITILSMGPPNTEQSLMEAMRKGADDAILISDRKLAGSDSWATSLCLSKALKKILLDTNIIFAGLQTIDGDTAHVGPQVAEHMAFNQVTYVDKIEIVGEQLRVRKLIEGGYQTVMTPLPTVLSVTSVANTPRGPSLSASMKTSKDKIKVYNIEEIDLPEEEAGLPGSPTIVSRVKNVVIERPPVQLFNEGDVKTRVTGLLQAINNKGGINDE
jgi:electron transfer flavoprotein alpha/beta subunit